MLYIDSIERSSVILDKTTILDIEGEFSCLNLKDNELNRKLIKEIEHGEYINSVTFKDRFGVTLSTEDLSTGCKAAILLGSNPDKRVSLLECGSNALISVYKNIKQGKALVYDRYAKFDTLHPNNIIIDVVLNGYRFTTLDRLNYYITDEQGYDVDLSREGIQCLE